MTGASPGFWPCTPHGCMKMLEAIGYDLRGKHAVVIGRSNIVGKPMAMMLLAKSATVTICHSAHARPGRHHAPGRRRRGRGRQAQPADGRHGEARRGGHRRRHEPQGRRQAGGDVDFDGVKEVAGWITPVPGGVGPMTRAMLLVNTLEAERTERAAGK
jgi:methylenetetrahydrofolate dehydrogenase (NADP+)/methenyltetrahydrofolate cyclohydrolase